MVRQVDCGELYGGAFHVEILIFFSFGVGFCLDFDLSRFEFEGTVEA
jgi:hypothetical protein